MTATNLRLIEANNSPLLVADPAQPRFVVSANRVDAPTFGCGLDVSGDGGKGWIGANPVPKEPPGADTCYAPEVVFGPDGTLYYLFVGLAGAGNAPMGVFLTTSSDWGRTFRTPWPILGGENYMVRLAVDRSVGKRGRLYLAWVHSSVEAPTGGFPAAPNPIQAAFSDDGGRTFSEPVTVSDAGRARVVAPAMVVGADHAVSIAYYDLGDDARDYQGLDGPTWDKPWSLVVSTSTDEGRNYGTGVVVTSDIAPPGRVNLIYTMAAPALAAGTGGQAYAAWPDARFGDPDVLLSASGDGGRSWGAPVRVNDDGRGDAATQDLPRLAVAPGGRVDAVFLDRRNDPENLRNDVYYTYSVDGGRTFAPNLRVTTESSDSRIGQHYQIPSAAGLTEIGSRLGLLSRADDAVAAWPDTRNGQIGFHEQDVFSSIITTERSAAPPTGGGSPGGFVVVLVAAVVIGAGGGIALLLVRSRRRARARTLS